MDETMNENGPQMPKWVAIPVLLMAVIILARLLAPVFLRSDLAWIIFTP